MCPNCNCNCNCNIPEYAFSPNPNVSPELSVTTIFEFRHCAIQFQDWASSFETERFPSTGCNIYITSGQRLSKAVSIILLSRSPKSRRSHVIKPVKRDAAVSRQYYNGRMGCLGCVNSNNVVVIRRSRILEENGNTRLYS